MSNPIVNFAVRGFQIVFAACVLGLSVSLAKGHHLGHAPITLGYVAFVGGISLVAGFVGIAASFVEFLQGNIGLLVDGFITLLNLAGGVLVAIKLKGVKCEWSNNSDTNNKKIIGSDLINGGKFGKKIEDCFYCTTQSGLDTMISRCKMNQADTAFMFLTVVVLLVSLTFTFLRMKKGY